MFFVYLLIIKEIDHVNSIILLVKAEEKKKKIF